MKFRNVTQQVITAGGRQITPGQIVELNEEIGQKTTGLQPVGNSSQQLLTEAPLGFAKAEKQNG